MQLKSIPNDATICTTLHCDLHHITPQSLCFFLQNRLQKRYNSFNYALKTIENSNKNEIKNKNKKLICRTKNKL